VKKILLLIIIAFATNVSAQKIQVTEQLDSIEIMLGSQCHLFLSVTAKETADVKFPDFSQTKLIAPGIEVVQQMRGDSIVNDDGTIKQTVVYRITSFEPKLHYIAPLNVMVDGKKIMGKKLALKVIDVPVDTTKLDQFFPPKDIQTNPFMIAEWIPAISLYFIASLMAVIAMLCYLMKKGNKPIRISFRIIKRVPAHIKAMSAIDEIKDNKLAIAENQKEYYTRLTDTLRIYIKERFGFSAMEMTTREIINRLQAEDPMKVAELREVFETADLVKFAKYSTLINENDRNLVSAIDFINSTKTEEIVEEHKEEEQLTEEQKQTNVTIKALKVLTYIAAFASAIILCITIWQVVMLIE
jgi:hypothetical protein